MALPPPRFNRIVVIESLEASEPQTGSQLAVYLRTLDKSLPVDLVRLDNASALRHTLRILAFEAAMDDKRSIIHVECHGGMATGLHLASGDAMPWEEFADLLRAHNTASRFQTFVAVSACFGGDLLGHTFAFRPCPFRVLVAPTDEVMPYDLMGAFRSFYRILLSTGNLATALAEMRKHSLECGAWFAEVAEGWFPYLVRTYIEGYCTREAIESRIEGLREEHVGVPLKVDDFYKQGASITGQYFDSFFHLDAIPSHVSMCEDQRARTQRLISAMRRSGKYIV